MFYERTQLRNGATVITERMEGVRSVALGLWVRVGNRDETPAQSGISHFMEHMLFKGTPTRSAFDISLEADALGADLNAFTSRECTCFYARVIDEHLDEVFDILADMLVNASFAPADMDLEREVVIEEIARNEDTPEDFVGDVFADALMPGHPLGRPVLGTAQHVAGFTSEDMRAYHAAHYTTGNVFVVACGNVSHTHVVELAERCLSGLAQGPCLQRGHPAAQPGRPLAVVTRDTEQAHILYGFPSIAQGDPTRYAHALLGVILGGSMSSRLFTEVREKRGLVYSIYASSQGYEERGMFAVYAGTRPENVGQVLALIAAELAKAAEDGVSEEELARACESTCSHLVLGLESTRSRMSRIGKKAVSCLPLPSTEETLERYRAVSRADVAEAAAHLFNEPPTIAIISPWQEHDIEGMLGS